MVTRFLAILCLLLSAHEINAQANRVPVKPAKATLKRTSEEVFLLRMLASSKADSRAQAVRQIETEHLGNARIGGLLRQVLERTHRRRTFDERLVLLGLLRYFPQEENVRWLAEQLKTENTRWLIAVLDELKTREDLPLASPEILGLTKRNDFQHNFGLRLATLETASKIEGKVKIEFMIQQLADADGVTKNFIVEHLAQTTGQDFGPDFEAWQEWWAGAKGVFDSRLALERKLSRREPKIDRDSLQFFDLAVTEKRIVFVIDRSHSMSLPMPRANWPLESKPTRKLTSRQRELMPDEPNRMDHARRELAATILALENETEFNILAFDHRVKAWREKLMPATKQNKQLALAFIRQIDHDGHTAWFDALERALRSDSNLEAVYFLSDGEPTVGKIVSAPRIVESITKENQFHRVAIHTIGLGASPTATQFLQQLATRNHGQFRSIGSNPRPVAARVNLVNGGIRPNKNFKYSPTKVLPRAMRPLTRIRSFPAKIADRRLADDELVLGLEFNGKSKAYPINMMTGPSREIFNDELGDTPIAATW